MLKIIVLILSFLSLFNNTAYADYYLYVDNPDPENFEIFYEDKQLNSHVSPSYTYSSNSDMISHLCYRYVTIPVSHYISIRYKTSKLPFCSLHIGEKVGVGLCSIINSQAGNTLWLSIPNKLNGTSAPAPIIRHDCDDKPFVRYPEPQLGGWGG